MREEGLSAQRGTYKHNLRGRINPADLEPHPRYCELAELADLYAHFPVFSGERGYRQHRCSVREWTLHGWL